MNKIQSKLVQGIVGLRKIFSNQYFSLNSQLLFKQQKNSVFNISKALLLSSFLLSTFLYRKKFRIFTQTNESQQQQEKEKDEGNKQQIKFEIFSDEEYKKAIEDKNDIIILVDPLRFKEEFINEIQQFLNNFNNFQKVVKGKPVKYFVIEFKTDQEMKDFDQKYNIGLEPDTILLLKNRYMSETLYKFGPYDYFDNQDYIFKYFRKLSKLNKKTYDEFIKTLSYITSDTIIVCAYVDKEHPEYSKFSKRLAILSLIKEYVDNKQLHILLVNDREIAKQLNIDQEQGQVHLLMKSSKGTFNQSNIELQGKKFLIKKSANLNDRMIEIINKNAQVYCENNIFAAKSFDNNRAKYQIVLEVNENSISVQERTKLLEIIGKFNQTLRDNHRELFDMVNFVKLNRPLIDQKFQIYARDDVKTIGKIQEHQVQTQQEREALGLTADDQKPHSYIYNFNVKEKQLDTQNLINWFDEVKQGKAKEYFKSGKEPAYRRYSRKVASSNFKKTIIDNDKDQIMFFYSTHCHACKHYGPFYENLALESIKAGNQNIEFNRMNTDKNTIDCAPNFPYTPVFQVFKSNQKQLPYVYRSGKFTPILLKNFIYITTEFKVIEEEVFEKIYTNFKSINPFEKEQQQNNNNIQ